MASSVRSFNMHRRRQRILAETAAVIAAGGVQALNTRSLAEAAGVTTPTLYNLIGSKQDILRALESAAIDRTESRLLSLEHAGALDMVEAIVLESVRLIAADTTFYRGAFLASFKLAVDDTTAGAHKPAMSRSVQVALRACEAAAREGSLRGTISVADLAEQMFACYRLPLLDWTFRRIDLEEFARQALRGFYLCLAADAEDAFRGELLDRLDALYRDRAHPAEGILEEARK